MTNRPSFITHALRRSLQPAAFIALAGAVALASVLPSVVQAGSATKSIVEAGPFSPGDTATVQIKFTRPTVRITPSVELVVVVDTSGSINTAITNDLKPKLTTWANSLTNYYGSVRVGITKIGNGTASFDDDSSDDYKHAENANMFSSGTTTPYANSTVGYDKAALIANSTDLNRLKSAISAIKVEPVNNPNSPDGVNSYTSDIGAGLNRAKGMFTTDPATAKYVLLITDGMANKSYCPINSSGNPAVAFPSGTIMQVMPAGNDWNANLWVQTEYRTEDANFPSYYPYTYGEPGVCKPYIVNYHSAMGWRAQQFTPDIANRYGPSNIHSTDISGQILDQINKKLQYVHATIDDYLNPDVFGAVTAWGGLYNCDSGSPGAQITGNTWTPSGTRALDVTPRLTAANTYCIQFTANIKSGALGGSQPVNTTGNTITYKDEDGNIVGTDTITQGSINVISNVNLQPDNFILTDASGNQKSTFLVNEPIYVRTSIQNVGTDASASGSITRFYSNEINTLPINAADTPDMWFTRGSFSGGASYDYGSYPGGSKETSFMSGSGLTYWTKATAGTYYGRIFVNYLGGGGTTYESTYSDNQARFTYTVVAPSDLTLSNFDTTNASGTTKYVFDRNEQIYARITASNSNSNPTQVAIQTQMYANKPSTVAVGTLSDITPSGMYIQHGLFAANSNYVYGSYPGGNFNSSYNGQKSWSVSVSTGVLTARAYINYDQSQNETNYTNNQTTQHYAVIVPPTNLTTTMTSCRNVALGWTGGAGIEQYRIHITNTGTGTSTDDTTASTSFNEDLGEGPNNYQWTLFPQVTVDGVVRDGNSVSGGTFSTQACPHFDITAPSPATINPGDTTPFTENVAITYLPTNSYWNANTDHVTLTIRDMRSGTFDCTSIPAKGSAHSGSIDSGNITAKMSNGTSSITVKALTSPVPMTITASATATLGDYTLCLGAWSDVSADEKMATLLIKIEMAPWLQVGGPAVGAQGAGDVHSNGPIGNIVIPSNPIQQYFFVTSSIGVATSASSLGINPLTRLSSLMANDWLWINYPPSSTPIKTTTYAGMLSAASRTAAPTEIAANQNLQPDGSCGASSTYHVAGNAVLDNGVAVDKDIQFPAACNGINRLFFVDGNLYVRDNLLDQTISGTLTFVVNGDVVVNSDISQMDGVYMFSGRFSDGVSGTQLVIHGSLLGLAGNSPSAGTGSFTLSGGNTGLQRNLGAAANATQPAELIYYQPKYLYVLKNSDLGGSTFSWTE